MTLPVRPEDGADLVHVEALKDLQSQVGVGATADFAARYLDSLPARLARLRQAALTQDRDDCLAAALSLRSASAMVGAQPLAEAAEEYVVAARTGRWPSLRTLLRVCRIGQATAAAMSCCLRALRVPPLGLGAQPAEVSR